MGQKLDCRIVQDLLPNYIEGLTSEVTNTTIKEHLAACDDCKRVLQSMTRETKVVNKVPPKQINFLKKIRRRQWMTAGISVLVSVTILLGVYYFFSQKQFSVPSSEVTISDVYQMKDDSIHYRISANVEGYTSNVSLRSSGNSEIIRVYEHRRFFSNQTKSMVAIPERWADLNKPNTNNEITAIYYEGKNKSDRLTIWEKGMNIPKANAEQEAEYEKRSKDEKRLK